MQNRRFFISLAMTFVLTSCLVSCANYDEFNSQTADGIPIALTSNVTTRTESQNLQDTQIANSVKVGVFVTQGDNRSPDVDNHLLTANGAGGFTGETMYFPEGATSVNIYAYTPYNSEWSNKLNENNTFTIPADQSSDASYCKADLMIADVISIAPTTETVNLSFKHKLAKLNLDFNLENSQINLQGATISILNVQPTAAVNVSTGAIGVASGETIEIKAAQFDTEASTFSASVVFIPQTITRSTQFVRVVTVNNETYEAPLNQTIDFKSGKRYTYTVQFNDSEDGEIPSTEMTLVAGSVVEDWEDGMLDQYSIGDYVTKDGQIIKSADVTEDDKANIVAVLFSKKVSATDAAAGYNAYAMGLNVVTSKQWGTSSELVGAKVSTFAAALADLDGRTNTDLVLASDYYYNIEQKDATVFEYCERTANQSPVGTIGSNWFVPSIGQMIQVLNNLGNANITSSTEVSEGNTSSPIYYVTDNTLISTINTYATTVGKGDILDATGSSTYVTVTEPDESKFWCLQTKPTVSGDATSYAWGFGKNAGKTTSGRKLIPCVAIKLPSVSN